MFLDSADYKECCGCASCLDICPKGAIVMSKIHNGFAYPEIDANKCVNCGLCRKICAFESIKKDEEPICYFGWSLDSDIRMQSTSGGAFTAISKFFFQQHGEQTTHIYGAGWETPRQVKHLIVENIEDLAILRRSKYIQSDTRSIFRCVSNDLKNGHNVMFTGTPCQVASLKKFVPENLQENLLTVDIICNGVASPIVFSDYIESLERVRNSSVDSYSFRNKHTKENSQKFVHILFSNGKKVATESDIFYVAYQLRLLHRESCFNCPFSEENHTADITIGDFWHIEEKMPELRKERINGISCLMANTEKGECIINSLDNFYFVKTDLIPSAQKMSTNMRDDSMDLFYDDYSKEDIQQNLMNYIGKKRYLKCKYYRVINLINKAKRAIKR